MKESSRMTVACALTFFATMMLVGYAMGRATHPEKAAAEALGARVIRLELKSDMQDRINELDQR